MSRKALWVRLPPPPLCLWCKGVAYEAVNLGVPGSNPARHTVPVWLESERRRTRNAVDVGATPTAGPLVRSQEYRGQESVRIP